MIKILVLDDEKGIIEQLKSFFGYRGYKVFTATTGKEAISIIDKENPNILLLDIKMEGVSGLDILKYAKEKNSKVKTVMLTALKDIDTKSQAKELGADEYITKPFSLQDIERLVIRLVNEVLREEEPKK